MNVNSSHWLVVTLDWYVETAPGSSLLSVKALFILSLSLYHNDMLKIFIYFYSFDIFLLRVFY
jgi:hypothetical protein